MYLWSFGDANLGETWSEPAIGKVKMADDTDKWVAFIGGGFDSTHSNYNLRNQNDRGILRHRSIQRREVLGIL